MEHKLPAKVGHVAHHLHSYVHRAESVAHCAYLGMVSFGSHDYYLAAAAMLSTVVIGALLHVVIAMAGEA
jgi:hypothetical protein